MKRCNNCFELMNDEFRACPYCGFIPGNPPKELFHLFPGKELSDRYIVGKVLGFGGFGITYKAWDKKLETVVAVKEYYPSGIVNRIPGEKELIIYAQKREAEFYFGKERFLEEAKNMAKFNSEPNIINVFEYFEENNTAYIVMEYLDGISLKAYLQKNGGKLDTETSLKIMTAISNALGIIHSKGIIHRDVSPDNIFLCSNGAIKLIDFGAARFSLDENKLMTIILKPGFAPPEQYEKINRQGPWTDVYALGATFYYIITGKKPEESTNRKINDKVLYPHELDPQIPENISNAIMKAMAIDVELRFKNVESFQNALGQKKAVLPVAVEKKRRRRTRNIGVIAASLIIVLGAAGVAFKVNSDRKAEKLIGSSIVMWYCKSGDADIDTAEEAAYTSIKDDFNAAFPDVDITIVGFNQAEYEAAFNSDELEMPNIYEYEENMANAFVKNGSPVSLQEIYNSDALSECTVLRSAPNYFGGYSYLPLGFEAPIVFANTSAPDIKISSLDGFGTSGNNSFEHDYQPLSKMFAKTDSYYSENAMSDFINGDLMYYGTSISNYQTVRDSMQGQYKVIEYDREELYCRFGDVFTTSSNNPKNEKAIVKFLEFMLKESEQDKLHIQNESAYLPVNDKVLDVYVTVNNDFAGIFDDKENFIVEK